MLFVPLWRGGAARPSPATVTQAGVELLQRGGGTVATQTGATLLQGRRRTRVTQIAAVLIWKPVPVEPGEPAPAECVVEPPSADCWPGDQGDASVRALTPEEPPQAGTWGDTPDPDAGKVERKKG